MHKVFTMVGIAHGCTVGYKEVVDRISKIRAPLRILRFCVICAIEGIVKNKHGFALVEINSVKYRLER